MSQKIEDEQNNWRNYSPGITWELGKLQMLQERFMWKILLGKKTKCLKMR